MGVYIKGMKMPSECYVCPFRYYGRCFASSNRMRVKAEGKPKNCPLIEVPPHGDLVDAQEILRTLQVAAFSTYEDYEEAFDTIDFAETVIPADEERSNATTD